jgi:membrane-bound ClpP family serine protease
MFAEAIAVGIAVATAIGTIRKLLMLHVHAVGKISAAVVMALGIVGVFLLVWQS